MVHPCFTILTLAFFALTSALPLSSPSSPLFARQQNGPTVCAGVIIPDFALAHADCLGAANAIAASFRRPDSPIFWYSSSTEEHLRMAVIPGETVPRFWTNGRCRVSLGWRNGQVPPRPPRTSPSALQDIAKAISGQCVLTGKRTKGVQAISRSWIEFEDSGMDLTVQVYRSHEDRGLQDIIVSGLLNRTGPGWLLLFLSQAAKYMAYDVRPSD